MALSDIDVYKLKTRLNALYRLYTLDQAEIDAFLISYTLFDGDWNTNTGKREEQIVDLVNRSGPFIGAVDNPTADELGISTTSYQIVCQKPDRY